MHNAVRQRAKTAFIIVCWNNQDLLPECLASIKAQTNTSHKVIIVDNASHDASVEVARKEMPEAEIIEEKENHGFAKGNNIAIQKALEDEEVGYIALLNTDARIESTWLEILTDFCVSKPQAACMQGTTLDYYNHDVIDSTHIFISRNGQGTQGNWRNISQTEFGPKKVFGVNAAACLITRKFIEAQPFGTELFDELMFMYLEDVDLAARATTMGWDNYLVPGARALHMGSASSGKNPGFSLYYTFRNNSALLLKNLPFRMVLAMTPAILKGDLDTIATLRHRGQNKATRMVIKGRLVGLLRLPLYWKKIRALRRARSVPYEYLWYLMQRGY